MQEVIDKIIKIIGKITIADIISIIVFITILKDGRFSKKERYIRKIERCIKSQEINIAHLMYEKNIIARDFIQFHTK
ncbi:MAG: hypothetical protein FWG85_00280 [Bacteroidetes bacterium]|nr:hypothetical protein [Bacteroidota bacterium]